MWSIPEAMNAPAVAGADINAEEGDGKTPLSLAGERNR